MSRAYSLIVISKVLAPANCKPRTMTIKTGAFIGSKNAGLIEKIKREITKLIKSEAKEHYNVKVEVKSTVEITPINSFTLKYYE